MAFTILERNENGNVVLLRTTASPMILYRLRVDGVKGYPVRDKTTGTEDLAIARTKAMDHYRTLLWEQSKGMSVGMPTFDRAGKAYLTHLQHQFETKQVSEARVKDATNRFTKWLKPYFGRRMLGDIHAGDIIKYHQWRLEQHKQLQDTRKYRTYKTKDGREIRQATLFIQAPGPNSASNDEILIRQIFKHALQLRMITLKEMIVFQNTKKQPTRRGNFTFEQMLALKKHLAQSVINGSNHPRIHWERQQYQLFVWWMIGSGLRPNEMLNLRWCDVQVRAIKGVENVKINIRPDGFSTRKHRPRTFYGQPELANAYHELAALHPGHKPDDFMFRTREGKKHSGYSVQFGRTLEELGIDRSHDGLALTVYSLRHFYATDRLENGVDIAILADNMGTSVDMITHHYGHLLADRVREHSIQVRDEDDED